MPAIILQKRFVHPKKMMLIFIKITIFVPINEFGGPLPAMQLLSLHLHKIAQTPEAPGILTKATVALRPKSF